jgi:Ni,Fe-hydrogenase I large subunit
MANRAAGTYEVDPISRIEGHLGIKVTTDGSTITDAQAHGNLWRGFENFLLGRDVNDAITFTQRICGVCPVPHGMTSTYAVDTVLGYSAGHITFANDGTYGVPPKAVNIRNMVLGAEFLMSSITHFYHLVAPSYVQGPNMPPWTPYFNDNFYVEALRSGGAAAPGKNATDGFSDSVWSTVIRSYVVALRVRRLTFEAGALFAGRMPMTSVYCGGGVTFDGTENLTSRATMFEDIMKEIGLFIIQEYVPIALALGLLYPDYDNLHNDTLAGVTTHGYGSGLGRFLAWGAFPDPDNMTSAAALDLPGGYADWNGGGGDFVASTKGQIAAQYFAGGTNAVVDNLTEDIANSRYEVDAARDAAAYTVGKHAHTSASAAYPGDVSRTKPKRANGYTYMKAPRWAGKSCEVGPLARLVVAGLIQDNVALATSVGAAYMAYVKTTPGGRTGLNPAMVSADIAVALLRAGLATLDVDGVGNGLDYATVAGYVTAHPELGATVHDRIAAVYQLNITVITGTITTWIVGLKSGASTMDRLRARAIESLYLVQKMLGAYTPATGTWTTATRGTWGGGGWLAKLKAETGGANDTSTSTWRSRPIPTGVVQGWGATEAPRGALMHQVTISGGKITKYQCIVPTTWNGSPVTGSAAVKSNHGAIEAAVIGAPLANLPKSFPSQDGVHSVSAQGGVEVLRIAQSFDPCIACAIH